MTMRINDNGTDREMTADEIEQHKTFALDFAAQADADKAAATAKESARTALLAKLGITEAEAKLLLGL